MISSKIAQKTGEMSSFELNFSLLATNNRFYLLNSPAYAPVPIYNVMV